MRKDYMLNKSFVQSITRTSNHMRKCKCKQSRAQTITCASSHIHKQSRAQAVRCVNNHQRKHLRPQVVTCASAHACTQQQLSLTQKRRAPAVFFAAFCLCFRHLLNLVKATLFSFVLGQWDVILDLPAQIPASVPSDRWSRKMTWKIMHAGGSGYISGASGYIRVGYIRVHPGTSGYMSGGSDFQSVTKMELEAENHRRLLHFRVFSRDEATL